MAETRDPAREAAFRLMRGVTDEGRTLAMQASAPFLERLSPEARARAGRLAAQGLRHAGRADALLKGLMRKPPKPAIRDALRLAVAEMLEEGAPAHAVVNDAVARIRKLAKGPGEARALGGMANAVLRKAGVMADDWAAIPAPGLPDWLGQPIAKAWGKPAARTIATAHLRPAPLDLTPRDGDAAALAAVVNGLVLPTGSVRLPPGAHVTALPGFEAGAFWVQDAAAAIPARLLAAQPGEQVADLCAAPGGKTLQLAATGAQVTAVELSPHRAPRIAENLSRCGLTADIVIADALEWRPPQPLDAVLLDAPCSATGTIRRHPDLPHLRDGGAIKEITALQARLIDHAITLLKPGGRLIYAVCSLLPDEGEGQIRAALARHPGLRLIPADLPGLPAGALGADGTIRTRPDMWADQGGLDGFFIAGLAIR